MNLSVKLLESYLCCEDLEQWKKLTDDGIIGFSVVFQSAKHVGPSNLELRASNTHLLLFVIFVSTINILWIVLLQSIYSISILVLTYKSYSKSMCDLR